MVPTIYKEAFAYTVLATIFLVAIIATFYAFSHFPLLTLLYCGFGFLCMLRKIKEDLHIVDKMRLNHLREKKGSNNVSLAESTPATFLDIITAMVVAPVFPLIILCLHFHSKYSY